MADAFNWDESVNWRHNQKVPSEAEAGRKKSIFKRAGLTTVREKKTDTPPFIMRTVTYDTWRKHYAKDKDGNYRGTHAPAEDCLLKPDDVRKWNGDEPTTMADKWTRGKNALPVYAEVHEEGMVPEYEADYNGPPREGAPPPDEYIFSRDEDDLASHLERRDTSAQERKEQEALFADIARQREASRTQSSSTASASASLTHALPGSGRTIDGKTSEQVIAEAREKAKNPQKEGWRKKFQRGAEMAGMGGY